MRTPTWWTIEIFKGDRRTFLNCPESQEAAENYYSCLKRMFEGDMRPVSVVMKSGMGPDHIIERREWENSAKWETDDKVRGEAV